MKIRFFSLLIVALIAMSNVFATSNLGKPEFIAAFTEANKLMEEKFWDQAAKEWRNVLAMDPENININYKLGLCYLQSSSEKNKTVFHLEKAVKQVTHNYLPEDVTEKRASDFALYSLAEAYRLHYNFTASNFYFNKFKDLVGTKNRELTSEIEKELNININADEFTKDTAKVVVTNLGDKVNSIFPE